MSRVFGAHGGMLTAEELVQSMVGEQGDSSGLRVDGERRHSIRKRRAVAELVRAREVALVGAIRRPAPLLSFTSIAPMEISARACRA
jgi:hypothetical protein